MDLNQYLEIRRAYNTLRKESPSSSRLIFDEYAVLCALHDRKDVTATDLARELGVSCPTMTHRGNHLAELGYLSRKPSHEDRRRLRCTLTRRGLTYVNRISQIILEEKPADSTLVGLDVLSFIPIVARMGSLPMTADSLTLLCFAISGAESMTVNRIVEETGMLQPTISMAILRLEGTGCLDRPGECPAAGRRPMRRGAGCTITAEGRAMAEEIAAEVKEI